MEKNELCLYQPSSVQITTKNLFGLQQHIHAINQYLSTLDLSNTRLKTFLIPQESTKIQFRHWNSHYIRTSKICTCSLLFMFSRLLHSSFLQCTNQEDNPLKYYLSMQLHNRDINLARKLQNFGLKSTLGKGRNCRKWLMCELSF